MGYEEYVPEILGHVKCPGCGKELNIFWWNRCKTLKMAVCHNDYCPNRFHPFNPDGTGMVSMRKPDESEEFNDWVKSLGD